MALKFLNKKGWHTGSLRNIENVWKAEQKHEAEQKKLEELRKQIQDEREQSEFRQLQEQAGLVLKQERLEFLYDSGLAVGKNSSDSFALGKTVEPQKTETDNELNKLAAVPGALFVGEKPASANDTWRKLHSDPLLMIRQREQEALSQIKNNPVKMEMIKKSLDAKKLRKEEKERKKAAKKKHKKEKRKRETSSDTDSGMDIHNELGKMRQKDKPHKQSMCSNSESKMDRGLKNDEDMKSKRDNLNGLTGRYSANFKIPPYREHLKNSEKLRERKYDQERPRSPLSYRRHRAQSPSENGERHRSRSPLNHGKILSQRQRYRSRSPSEYGARCRSRSPSDHVQSLRRQRRKSQSPSDYGSRHRSRSPDGWGNGVHPDHRNKFASHQDRESNSHARGTDSWSSEKNPSAVPDILTKPVSRPKYQAGKLSEEEKASRLSEMQMDAELHDEQRWRRLKKASEADAREAIEAARRSGKNFLDATNKSVYGAEKGGSSTIEESVRRRTHYLQGSAAATEGNAFRR